MLSNGLRRMHEEVGSEHRSRVGSNHDCVDELVHSPIRIRVTDPSVSNAPYMNARFLGVSATGLMLGVDFILPRTLVEICMQGRSSFGQVQYCMSAAGGFHVGILLAKAC